MSITLFCVNHSDSVDSVAFSERHAEIFGSNLIKEQTFSSINRHTHTPGDSIRKMRQPSGG